MRNPTLLLRREEVTLPASDPTLATADATKDTTIEFAKRELGYVPPSEKARIIEAEARRKGIERPLGKALVEAGIKPFTHESVNNYKKQMARSFMLSNKTLSDGWLIFLSLVGIVVATFLWSRIEEGLALVPLGIVVIAFIAASILKEHSPTGKHLTFFDYLVCVLFIASGVIIAFIIGEFTGPPKKLWRTTPIKGYEGDVPRFALETAQEIKMRCPNTEFFIEELVENKARKDPFLVAECGEDEFKERVYVEVWAEPGFEQKRIA